MKHLALPIPVVLCVLWAATPLSASDPRQRSVALSRPDASASVTVRAIAGGVTIEGHDQSVVQIELVGPEAPAISRALRITERGNRIEIQGEPGAGAGRPLDLRLRVPRRTSLRVRAVGSQPITVTGTSGQLEVSNRLGDVEARGMVGSVVAESEEGDIRVELLAVSHELPTALSTFHGDVELVLPNDLNARFSLRSKRGTIHSDFVIEADADQTPGHADPRIVRGTAGEGGVLISIKTYNGDIAVRAARALAPDE